MAKDYDYPSYDAGGRVEKYEEGGEVKKKKKVSKEFSYEVADKKLETYKNKKGKKRYKADVVISVDASHVGGKKGKKRYYKSTGRSSDMQYSINKGAFSAREKVVTNPADSLTTSEYKKLKKKE